LGNSVFLGKALNYVPIRLVAVEQHFRCSALGRHGKLNAMTETKPKRRWFRFSIRDLLWLTVVVGMAIGWWLDHYRQTTLTAEGTAFAESLLPREQTIGYLQRQIQKVQQIRNDAISRNNLATIATCDKSIAEYQHSIDERREQLRQAAIR
jgi:hypothetical protein